MTRSRFFGIAMLALLFAAGAAQAQDACDRYSLSLTTTSVPPQSMTGIKRWEEIRPTQAHASDVLVLGDSLAESWPQDLALKDLKASFFDLGVNRDRVQNVLWRLNDFDTTLINPSRIVVIVGTNNLSDPDPIACSIAKGIETVVVKARRFWPNANIVLFPILPRGQDFQFRDDVRLEINQTIEAWARTQHRIKTISINEDKLTCNQRGAALGGNLNACSPNLVCNNYENDNVHITRSGYEYLSSLLPW